MYNGFNVDVHIHGHNMRFLTVALLALNGSSFPSASCAGCFNFELVESVGGRTGTCIMYNGFNVDVHIHGHNMRFLTVALLALNGSSFPSASCAGCFNFELVESVGGRTGTCIMCNGFNVDVHGHNMRFLTVALLALIVWSFPSAGCFIPVSVGGRYGVFPICTTVGEVWTHNVIMHQNSHLVIKTLSQIIQNLSSLLFDLIS